MLCAHYQEKLQDSLEQRQKEVRVALNRLEAGLNEGGELLSEERLAILALPPTTLLQRLREGHLAPTHVLKAFQAKAIVTTYRVNCVTEFIPQAEAWATALEAGPPEARNLPLFGLPVSVKDNIDVEGRDSTLGLAKKLYRPATCHSAIVHALRSQGAVPFCKTNVPQTCNSYGCSNPVWGETVNPSNMERTCGGSSGGEAALVGAGGSVFGVGADLAGSVRIPAHFCGVVGLKTTTGRLSNKGITTATKGATGILSAPGLLGRDVEIVVAGMRALLEGDLMFQADPKLVPLHWRHHLYTDDRPLRIGWYDHDGVFPVTPGCQRAVAVAREALQAAGHQLVPFTPPEVHQAFNIMAACVTSDQGHGLLQLLKGEVVDQSISTNAKIMAAPRFVKAVQKHIMQEKSPLMAKFLSNETAKSHQLLRALGEQEDYVGQLTEAWTTARLDLLLSPAFPMPAPPHSYPTKIMAAMITSALYNLCNFPAGVVPVTHETQDDQDKLDDYPTDDLMFQLVKEATRGATGLPIAAQVVGLPWQEEVVCRGMRDLQDQLKTAQAGTDPVFP
ncbi:fatty acid amide hydrolase 1-like [Procambarus clarkii]|uniref:fatty acid amide hydrolase 1-like n=1 Tax=Procambarus clarkii TaxID=6728 RepID=UPI003741FDA6